MVRAALVQFSGHIDKNINIEKAENLARQAAGNGAKVVCFPELCTTIYFCFDRDKKWFETAEPVPGPAVDRLRQVARETGTVIVYPLYENDNGVLYNTAAVIGPDGELIGKYRKMSIPQILRTVKSGRDARRRAVLLPARQPRASRCSTRPFGLKIGILICYDRHFPEAARVLGLKGAHLLLVPTATYRDWIRDVWEIELRGHAIANMFYVGGVNKVGKDVGGPADRHYFGTALFIDPKGGVHVPRGRQGGRDPLRRHRSQGVRRRARPLGLLQVPAPRRLRRRGERDAVSRWTADLFVKDCRVVKPDGVVDCGLAIRDGIDRGRAPPRARRWTPAAPSTRAGASSSPGSSTRTCTSATPPSRSPRTARRRAGTPSPAA